MGSQRIGWLKYGIGLSFRGDGPSAALPSCSDSEDRPMSMTKKASIPEERKTTRGKSSALVDTRVIYCGDNLEQLRKLPDGCVDLIYIDPPFNSNRNYEVFWGETKEKRSFEDRHASTQAYIEFMRPRCVELHRVLKSTGSFYYHCDWHASPLRQSHARSDFRGEQFSERNRLEASRRSQRC